jgi:flotillin
LTQKAEAFRQFNEAAILDLVVKVMPEMVRAASEPVAAIDKLTVISTDGASALVRSVASNVEQGLQIGSDLTGLDLRRLLSRHTASDVAAVATGPAAADSTGADGAAGS